MKNKKQKGNALFFILIAIALLGLLTVTMSRSGSNSNDTGSYEQSQIVASEVLNYAKSIENAVQSLLARGCSENEISFENSGVAGYTNPNSPADKSCHVFDVAGAGMTYIVPNENWLENSQSAAAGYGEWFFTMQANINNHPDFSHVLRIVLPYTKKDICLQINNSAKVTNPSENPPKDGGSAFNYNSAAHKYTGTPPFGTANAINPADGSLDAKLTGCFEGDTFPSGGYHIFHVLHAR